MSRSGSADSSLSLTGTGWQRGQRGADGDSKTRGPEGDFEWAGKKRSRPKVSFSLHMPSPQSELDSDDEDMETYEIAKYPTTDRSVYDRNKKPCKLPNIRKHRKGGDREETLTSNFPKHPAKLPALKKNQEMAEKGLINPKKLMKRANTHAVINFNPDDIPQSTGKNKKAAKKRISRKMRGRKLSNRGPSIDEDDQLSEYGECETSDEDSQTSSDDSDSDTISTDGEDEDVFEKRVRDDITISQCYFNLNFYKGGGGGYGSFKIE